MNEKTNEKTRLRPALWSAPVLLLAVVSSAVSASAGLVEFQGSLEIEFLSIPGGDLVATGTGVGDQVTSGGRVAELTFPAGLWPSQRSHRPGHRPLRLPTPGDARHAVEFVGA